jgi:hypothetical protein
MKSVNISSFWELKEKRIGTDDVEELPNLFGLLALNHIGNRFASDVPTIRNGDRVTL